MTTPRKNNLALIVVDAQVGVMQGAWEAARIIENIGIAVNKARGQRVPIIWVQHSDDELVYDSPAWQWVPELSPLADEIRIDKQYNSSFEQTPLEETLASLGATHVILAGAATNWCIRATAYGALERGYDLTLLEDAHTTDTIDLDNGVNYRGRRCHPRPKCNNEMVKLPRTFQFCNFGRRGRFHPRMKTDLIW